LTVYQADGGDGETTVAEAEPKLREVVKKPDAPSADAAEVVKKWAKK
jgi:hypothetical protein